MRLIFIHEALLALAAEGLKGVSGSGKDVSMKQSAPLSDPSLLAATEEDAGAHLGEQPEPVTPVITVAQRAGSPQYRFAQSGTDETHWDHYPNSSAMMKRALLTASGAVLFPILGVVAGAMVPHAMSTFGIVVPGVGTLHAPLISGGIAAILQASSAALVSGGGAALGGIAGASVDAIYRSTRSEDSHSRETSMSTTGEDSTEYMEKEISHKEMR